YTDLPAYPDGHPLRNKEQITVPLGANWMTLTRGGLEFVGNGYHGEGGIDFHAGAFKGTGKDAVDEVRVWLKFSPGTPIAAMESVVIDAPLEEPKEFEFM